MRLRALLIVLAGLASFGQAACTESLIGPASALRGERTERVVASASRSPGAKPWEPLEVVLDHPPQVRAVPLVADDLATPPGSSSPLSRVDPDARSALLRDGLYTSPPLPTSTRMGALYNDIRARGGPSLVTTDALFELTHLALAEALAEVDARVILPELATLLARVDTALAVEAKGASSDLLAPYAMARGVVAVARSLLDTSYAPSLDLAEPVALEIGRVLGQKEAESTLLGVRVDYSTLSLRAGADAQRALVSIPSGGTAALSGSGGGGGGGASRTRVFRALAWLSTAPLILREDGAGRDRVGLFRVHTRAALLLARAVRPDVDAEAARAWDRIESISRFLVGSADEPTLRDLDRVARTAGLDLADGRAVADVTRIDRVRRAIAKAANPRLDDGAGALVRFFSPRYAPDAEVLAASTRRPGAPRLPSADAVVDWMRTKEPSQERHDALYVSALDAVATLARPSAADPTLASASGAALAPRRAALARSAWTTLRHDFLTPGVELLPRAPSPPRITEIPLATFVEPHPEGIAKLLATVRQAQRGLTNLGAFTADSPARAVLSHVDELLTAAFEVAFLEASDEEATDSQMQVLASLPAWLDALEWATGSETPRVVDVHLDRGTRRVLEEATGGVGELALVVRQPGTGKLFVALGAWVRHVEMTQPASDRLGDAAWRARARLGGAPPP